MIFRYPIYGIPAGPTQRDLDACFLTYHSLSTQFAGARSFQFQHCRNGTTGLHSVHDRSMDQESSGLPLLCLSLSGAGQQQGPKPTAPATACAAPVTAMWLPTFAMASYKLKGAAWTPGWRDRQLAASLAQAADAWTRLLRADHPDHRFFAARRAPSRRW